MNNKKVFFLGIIVYTLSLAMPVWVCEKGTEFYGVDLLIIGIAGLLYGDPRWFCNLIVIAAVYSLLRSKPILEKTSIVLALLSFTTLFGPYFCGIAAGPLGDGVSPNIGSYFWVLSLCILTISIKLSRR